MKPNSNSSTSPSNSHRECTQVEYQQILGLLHRDKRQQAIELYNQDKAPQEQLRAVQGRFLPMRGREIILFRGALPESVEIYLDSFESKLKCPYTNGFQVQWDRC